MKTIIKSLSLSAVLVMLIAFAAKAQTITTGNSKNQPTMKTYVIEREIPGAGNFTPAQLKAISQTSCGVLKEMGPQIQWLHSYVTGNKIYCVYKAENEELVKEHAKKGGFPANSVSEVATIISPATAEQ